MARIPRKAQKIFAADAANNGVFGSAADNTKVLSDDLDVIQSKAAYELGWLEAVLGIKKFPALEEFQALHYMTTTQISYLFQEGIPEYNAATTYYQKSIVRETGTYQLYGSITDDNVGNALSDTDEWLPLIDLSALVQDATTSVKGIAMLATLTDVRARETTKIVTPDLLYDNGFITGDFKGTTRETVQDGWIWAAGTIGNASSNATNRANADTETLFNYYWNATAYNYVGGTASGAALQVYTSAGAPVAKGVSAAEDWAANRQIAVVDMRDRVPAGRGNMVGNAGRLSGQVEGVSGNGLGNGGGLESNSLEEGQLAEHFHFVVNADNPFVVTPPVETTNSIPKAYNPPGGNNYSFPGTALEPSHGKSSNTGEGSPHNNVQPTIICNYIIKL